MEMLQLLENISRYAILATLTGGVFGILIGEKIIPYIIITAYKDLYRHMYDVVIPYNLYYAVTAWCNLHLHVQ